MQITHKHWPSLYRFTQFPAVAPVASAPLVGPQLVVGTVAGTKRLVAPCLVDGVVAHPSTAVRSMLLVGLVSRHYSDGPVADASTDRAA